MYCKVVLTWCIIAIFVACVQTSFLRHAYCLDCHTLQLNPAYSVHYGRINCSKTNFPYCDESTASCSAVPSPSCEPADNFTCLSDGYFPDPWNCRSFHLCVDRNPTLYKCDPSLPSYYKYDVVLRRCSPSSICGFDCYGKSGVKVPHPADKNLFTFCYNGTAFLQDRCPANYELQEATQRCEPVCKVEGLMADLNDCRMFFRCIHQTGGYWRKHEQCPVGQGFNPLNIRCEQAYSELCATTNSTSKSSREMLYVL